MATFCKAARIFAHGSFRLPGDAMRRYNVNAQPTHLVLLNIYMWSDAKGRAELRHQLQNAQVVPYGC